MVSLSAAVKDPEFKALITELTQQTLREAGRPESWYVSEDFVETCLRRQLDGETASQEPGFGDPGDAVIALLVSSTAGVIARAVADLYVIPRLRKAFKSNSEPGAEKTLLPESQVALVNALLEALKSHPELPAELKSHIVRIVSNVLDKQDPKQ